GTDRVVVPRDRVVDPRRVAVGVDDRDDRDAEPLRLRHRDLLLAGVDDEDGRGQLLHRLDADERLLELLSLAVELERLLLRHPLKLARLLHLLELLESGDRLADRREVRQRTAQPALVHVEHAAPGRLLEDRLLRLLLGADEEHGAAAGGQVADERVGLAELLERLLEIDDVDAVALPEDVLLHLRVPSLGLVAEVYSGLQQLLHRQRRHASSFGLPPPRFVGSPRTAGTRSQARLAYGCGSPCGPARSNGPHYHRKRAACVMVDYVVYLALMRTYSSLRSQVQTRSSPRPRPRSIVISYSPPPMISRTRSRRTPSRSRPRSTTRSPPKAMATLSCSTRAGDLPRAIMIRPQFGSAPLSAVLTSGEFATLRAARSASRRLVAPRTAIATSFVAPSPSATGARASPRIRASAPAANCGSPRPRSRGRFSASPLASTATVSLVDWSASTVMRLNDRSTVRRTTAVSAAGATTASVAAKQNMVARWGSIMPTPFAIPPIVTARPSMSSRSAASFGFASVVRIASAAARPPWGESDLASFGS